MTKKLTIGVLALQGAVREHMRMIEKSGAEGLAIKHPEELSGIDGLIIPGGESTTITKLMRKYRFVDAIEKAFADGVPVFGTCAGLIVLAKKITGGTEPLLKLMDTEVKRNAFGRQRESFEADLDIPVIGEIPFTGVFIRAPWIEDVGKKVEVLSRFEDKIVMAEEKDLLVSAFHPELTDDNRIHSYFLEKIIQEREQRKALNVGSF